MKIGRRRAPFLLLFLASVVPLVVGDVLSETDSSVAQPKTYQRSSSSGPVGTEHAPVDGKDGLPHSGPFVETEAERLRKKKLEDVPQDEVVGADEELAIRPSTTTTKYVEVDEEIPTSNDGVMDDRNHMGPEEGTRGVEDGMSQRVKDSIYTEKKPSPPKEAGPLPQSEAEKMVKPSQESDTGIYKAEEVKKPLNLPTDLPTRPHDIPHPQNPSSPKDTTIDRSDSKSKPVAEHEAAVISPMHSMLLSFTMIIFSEIGDKTFLVACLMAMRHDRLLVFSAAFSALITMTVLSALLGHTVPSLIPKSITNFAAAGLFLVFGIKMLVEARKISPDEGVSEEMKEVEMELEEKESRARRSNRRQANISPYALEAGQGGFGHKLPSSMPSPPESPSSSRASSRDNSPSRRSKLDNAFAGINNLFSLLLSPAWVQTFVMTFLGEWGDRSQIATIAMAAGQDYWWVTAGALVGHAICTGMAVIGGKAIAGKVSLRTVTMGGAIAFLVFGVIYLLEAVY